MSNDERCLCCGSEPDSLVELSVFSHAAPIRRLPVYRCCAPPPSPTPMLRQAEDEWLRRQRELAERW